MQIFESNNKNTISTTALNYGKPRGLWCFCIIFFLKFDRFERAKPHSPLKVVPGCLGNPACLCYVPL